MTLAAAKRFLLAAFAAVAILFSGRAANAEFTPPPFTNSVIDQTGKLSAGEIAFLAGKIEGHRRATGFVVAVLVASSLEGEEIEDVAYKTFRAWKLGDEKKDNGVLLVIAPTERRTRIETGKGAGGALTDLQTKEIQSQRIGPLMRDGRVRDAIGAGVDGIYLELAKDPAAGPAQRKAHKPRATGLGFGLTGLLFLLVPFLIFFLVMRWVARLRARRHDYRRDDDDHRGGGGGFIAPIIFPGGGWGGGGGGGGDDGGDGGSFGGGDSGDYGGGGESGGGGSSDSY